MQWLQGHVLPTYADLMDSREDGVRRVQQRIGRRVNAGTRVLSGGATSSTQMPQPGPAAPPSPASSETDDNLYEPPESLHEPPGDSDSEGYVSPAATEGLGSVGDLVSTDEEGGGPVSDEPDYSLVCLQSPRASSVSDD